MNYYYTSSGERVAKSVIDSRVRKAKAKKVASMDYPHCEECGISSGTRFDCSHAISVKKCQENRQVELAWDVNNIRMLCRECHKKHDGLDLRF